MFFNLRLALRYLFSPNKSSFSSTASWLAIGGLSIGITLSGKKKWAAYFGKHSLHPNTGLHLYWRRYVLPYRQQHCPSGSWSRYA